MQWWKMHPREKMSTACVRRDEEKLGPPAIAHEDAPPPDPDPGIDKELHACAATQQRSRGRQQQQEGRSHGGTRARGERGSAGVRGRRMGIKTV